MAHIVRMDEIIHNRLCLVNNDGQIDGRKELDLRWWLGRVTSPALMRRRRRARLPSRSSASSRVEDVARKRGVVLCRLAGWLFGWFVDMVVPTWLLVDIPAQQRT